MWPDQRNAREEVREGGVGIPGGAKSEGRERTGPCWSEAIEQRSRVEGEVGGGGVEEMWGSGKEGLERGGKWSSGSKLSKGSGSLGVGGSGCSWHSIWAILMAGAMFMYSLTILGRTCHGDPVVNSKAVVDRSRGLEGSLSFEHMAEKPWNGNLLELEAAWNRLCFGEKPPETLNIALFVKKWPVGGTPGGLERHAMTLHRVLAERGHEVHVFTMSGDGTMPNDLNEGSLHIHFIQPNSNGGYDYSSAWTSFEQSNASRSFDLVHSESVALPHWRAKSVPNLAASWHGIAFEVIHSDIVHDLIRKPGELRSSDLEKAMSERLSKVAEEVRFFPSYRHHVATSDYVGDVLRTIYELPVANVHTILNGVDVSTFHPDPVKGAQFRAKYGVPLNASLVLGAAGRLVRDKGHPLLFEAFSEILQEHKDVYLLIAGTGPWGDRYTELVPNAKMLGPMPPSQLADFYNALDIFVNPTLRSQGLDHTLLEAMQCGKPLLATKFSSITWSVVKSEAFGYTFSPNVPALVTALNAVIKDGKEKLRQKGVACLNYASIMFTASKMGSAYERLFLCMKNEAYCHYPLPHDCPPYKSKRYNF